MDLEVCVCVSESVCVEICMNECKVCMHATHVDIIIFMCHAHACMHRHSYTIMYTRTRIRNRCRRNVSDGRNESGTGSYANNAGTLGMCEIEFLGTTCMHVYTRTHARTHARTHIRT